MTTEHKMTFEAGKKIENGEGFWTTDVYSFLEAQECGWFDGQNISTIVNIIVSRKSDGQWYGIGLSKEDAKQLLKQLSSIV